MAGAGNETAAGHHQLNHARRRRNRLMRYSRPIYLPASPEKFSYCDTREIQSLAQIGLVMISVFRRNGE